MRQKGSTSVAAKHTTQTTLDSRSQPSIARSSLDPVAANPHGGPLTREAQRYLEELAEVAEGTEWHPGPAIDLTGTLEAVADDNTEEAEDGEEEST